MRGGSLAKLLTENFPGGTGAEIGVWMGHHAKEILDNWNGHLFLVDIYASNPNYLRPSVTTDAAYEEIYAGARDLLDPHKGRITWKIGLSTEMAHQIENASLDFVYIDSAHDYPSVAEDLQAWYPKDKQGGWMTGHDYTLASFAGMEDMAPVHKLQPVTYAEMVKLPYGVKFAVDEFAIARKLVVMSHGFNWGFIKE